jgi:putative DNA primase/helicase
MTDITHIFGGAYSAKPESVEPVEVQLADAMRSAGIDPPADIKIDGQLHRFSTKGRKKDDSGYYVVFSDGVPAGVFGCWRDGVHNNFRADVGRELTAAEQMAISRRTAEAKAAREAEKKQKNERAASTVGMIWENAGAASPDHPYLKRKGVDPHGARITGDGRIMAPMFDAAGNLSSVQYIEESGEKQFHPGGAVKGCFWMLGDPDQTIFIAEGFATAATVLETTNQAVAVAFSAGNISQVAETIRNKFGKTQEIVIVADHDTGGVGKNYADQAAAKVGARVVMPPIEGMDANDYKLAGHDLHGLLYPPVVDWLIPADDFASKPAPIKWLVKHWLQANALIMVHGPSGGGKTFVVLDWMMHMASGQPEWLSNRVRGGEVVYLAGEGHHGLRGRVAAWKQHHGATSLDMYISRAGCDLNTPGGYQKAAEAIKALPTPPKIIVVDTLHRFLDGDENSAQDAKTMLDACGALMQEFECSVLLVHHTGVSDEAQHRARGSSAWKGALDIEISVVPSKNDGPIEIIQRKSKDAEVSDPVYVDLQSVPIKGWVDEDGEPVSSAVIVEGAEPIKVKADDKTAGLKKLFERAWWHTGSKRIDGAPYVSDSGMTEFLNGIKEKMHPVNELAKSGIIAIEGNGWIIVDRDWKNHLISK